MRHVQVMVEIGNLQAEVDRDLASLITALWRLGIETASSCQGYDGAHAHISMSPEAIAALARIVLARGSNGLLVRAAQCGPEDPGWWHYDTAGPFGFDSRRGEPLLLEVRTPKVGAVWFPLSDAAELAAILRAERERRDGAAALLVAHNLDRPLPPER